MLMSLVARTLARPAVADWLIRLAQRTPYSHIEVDGEVYMERYWLFNPYPSSKAERRWWKDVLPSIRIHRILREDQDLHDHPWNARTVILRGWYREEREADCVLMCRTHFYFRTRGQTTRLRFGEYHRIAAVSPGGAWTLFITRKKQGTWHFKVDGKEIPWREYQNAQLHKKGEPSE